MKKRALIYVRISMIKPKDGEDIRKMVSLGAQVQENECLKYCEENGYEAVGVYKDVDITSRIPPLERQVFISLFGRYERRRYAFVLQERSYSQGYLSDDTFGIASKKEQIKFYRRIESKPFNVR